MAVSAAMSDPWTREALAALEAGDRRRRLRAVRPVDAVTVELGGRLLKLFSSNDYLGLSADPAVRAAAANAATTHGMGPRGSALVCGYTEAHEALEAALADLKQAEAALLFPTGYQANLAVLSALGTADATIFSDALNHASIIDGCRLARARVEVYGHRDVDDLERRLKTTAGRRIVVTDEVFSMEGSLAPLRELAALRDRYGFTLVTDAAHSTLVFGARGGGLPEALGVLDAVDFQVGTLSKAFGTLGGFVACSALRREWLLNVGRTFVFTTAPPLPLVAAAHASLTAATPERRATLWARVEQMGARSPIVPYVVGAEADAMAMSARLLEAGFHVPAIRPPTVPVGTSRLRVALSAAHSAADIDALRSQLGSLAAYEPQGAATHTPGAAPS